VPSRRTSQPPDVRRRDLIYLGQLADAFVYEDDKQIREGHYIGEPGEMRYKVRFWEL
jgi:hypothetical protein